jgi:hypothetical protein
VFECIYCGQQWPDIPSNAQRIYIPDRQRQLVVIDRRAHDLKLINLAGEEIAPTEPISNSTADNRQGATQ